MAFIVEDDLVFVKGAKNGALYDFKDGNVYSLNRSACLVIEKYITKSILSKDERSFLDRIAYITKRKFTDFQARKYVFPVIHKQLSHLWLELTQHCNCRCIHCYEGKVHKESTNPISINKWKSIITEAKQLLCDSIQFIGGEPTLSSTLPELLYFAKDTGIKNISVYSNLIDIPEEHIQAVKDTGAKVKFTIYGSTPQIHDLITQNRGSFYKTLNNLKKLLSLKVPVSAGTVIMKENEDQYEHILSLLKEYGIMTCRYDECRILYNEKLNEHLPKVSKSIMSEPDFSADKRMFNLSAACNSCWYGKMTVTTDGTVFPCIMERHFSLGNVNNQSLTSIVNSSEIDRYWFLTYDKVEFCKDCEYRYSCKDCRPIAFAKNGNIFAQTYRCTYNPYNGEWKSFK